MRSTLTTITDYLRKPKEVKKVIHQKSGSQNFGLRAA